jgi:hypothetical protein
MISVDLVVTAKAIWERNEFGIIQIAGVVENCSRYCANPAIANKRNKK